MKNVFKFLFFLVIWWILNYTSTSIRDGFFDSIGATQQFQMYHPIIQEWVPSILWGMLTGLGTLGIVAISWSCTENLIDKISKK